MVNGGTGGVLGKGALAQAQALAHLEVNIQLVVRIGSSIIVMATKMAYQLVQFFSPWLQSDKFKFLLKW